MNTEEQLAASLKASEKDINAMLQAVALAMSDWAHVEEGLFNVFFNLIGATALGPPACAFVAAENMRTKIKMVNSMMRHTKAGRKVLTEWETLQGRCNKLRASRNALAHRRITTLKLGKAKAQQALIGYAHDIRHALKDEDEFGIPSHIKIDRVKAMSKDFRQLGVDLSKFANGIQHSEAKS